MSCINHKKYSRTIDPMYAPMVAKLWSKPDATEEEVARIAAKLQVLAYPDDIVRKAEQEAREAILAD
jgi:hypothetical protein